MELLWNAQYGFAPALAWALTHSLWQCAVLALMAALAFHLLGGRSAALRHAVGMGFLLAMVAIPMLGFARFWLQPAAEVNNGFLPALTTPVIAATPGVFVQQSSSLAGMLSLLWLLGVAVMLLRQLGGWGLVGALERRPFQALPPQWQRRADALQQALRISRTVVVRLADEVAAPFTARLLRPVIWLPMSLLTRLPVEQIEALLAHELAHIRRLDWLWNGLQCVAEALLFFHPGAWWLSRRIRQEREHACDDLAVGVCGDPIALAEALAELERHRHPLSRLLLAAHGGSLMKRISRLLSGPPARRRWVPLGLAALLVSSVVLATQLDPSRHHAPGLRIESSTDGTLRPGDYREITANGLDRQRYYRADVDARGNITESYTENGAARLIDPAVRTWLAEVSRLSVPPAPPSPPAPTAPPAPPMPPPPPLITAPRDSKEILRLVTADAAVAKQIGQPVAVIPDSVDGQMRVSGRNDQNGEAKLSFVLSGPRGRAQVMVSAARASSIWTITTLDVRPAPG